MDLAEEQLQRLRAAITRKGMAILMWMANKVFRNGVHGVFLEETGLQRVKDLVSDSNVSSSKNRVVFMPIFKSVVDIWVLYYIFMTQRMEIPFTFGNEEEIPKLSVVEEMSKITGYVFMNKDKQGLQNDYVNIQLLKETIAANVTVQMQLNAIRLKQNKVSLPSKPEVSITYLLQAYRLLESLKDNLYIVPVILTYDRIFELTHIAQEMLTA
jgi:glycerol-3-phosphate O-acyltransferase